MAILIDEIVQQLKNKGKTDQEIEKFKEWFLEEATVDFYNKLEEMLTEEETEEVEEMDDEEEAAGKIKEIFEKKYGRTTEQEFGEFLEKNLNNYLLKYQNL